LHYHFCLPLCFLQPPKNVQRPLLLSLETMRLSILCESCAQRSSIAGHLPDRCHPSLKTMMTARERDGSEHSARLYANTTLSIRILQRPKYAVDALQKYATGYHKQSPPFHSIQSSQCPFATRHHVFNSRAPSLRSDPITPSNVESLRRFRVTQVAVKSLDGTRCRAFAPADLAASEAGDDCHDESDNAL
jgi:hypothetical protein